jgi:predicted transcriptional regulator
VNVGAKISNTEVLMHVLHGLDLTDSEWRSVAWLADAERVTVENIARVILKARQAEVDVVMAGFAAMGQETLDSQKVEGT